MHVFCCYKAAWLKKKMFFASMLFYEDGFVEQLQAEWAMTTAFGISLKLEK